MENFDYMLSIRYLLVIPICIFITLFFWWIENTLTKRIGNIEKKIRFITKSAKRFMIIMVVLSGFFLVAGILTLVVLFEIDLTLNLFSQTLLFLTLQINLDKNNYILFGDKGFKIGWIIYPWKRLQKIEWDNDIGQNYWGLKITFKDRKLPEKLYILRKFKDEVAAEFDKYQSKIEPLPNKH